MKPAPPTIMARWLTATALVCGMAACGGGDDEYETERDLVEAFMDVSCDKLAECNQLGPVSAADCKARAVAEACPTENDCTDKRPDNISSDDVQDCLDDVEALTCPISRETAVPDSCLPFIPQEGELSALLAAYARR